MTLREKFKAVLCFHKVDRVPNVEIGYWEETFVRWQKEGLPADIPFCPPAGDRRYSRNSKELTDYFKLDSHNITYGVRITDNPVFGYTYKVLSEDHYKEKVRRSDGLVVERSKSNKGIFNELDWPVKTQKDWERLRESIKPGWHNISGGSSSAMPSEARDYAVNICMPGFFWQMRSWMGFEKACTLFYLDSDFANSMLDFWCKYLLDQFTLILKCFRPEFVILSEDMCYKNGSMISPEIAEKFLVPQYRKVVSCLNSKGVDIVGIDSDGFVDELIPVFYKAGVNLWLPFEIMCREAKDDLLTLGKKYPWLRMIGGIDKISLIKGKKNIDEELTKIALSVKRGGYIPTIDHKVPPEVSLEAYKYYLQKKAELLIVNQ